MLKKRRTATIIVKERKTLHLPKPIPKTRDKGLVAQICNRHNMEAPKVVNKTQSALLFMTCQEQITKMCFLLRCQFFPLLVTDGSQCYYRNRLIFLMSQFNRLQNLNVAAHPCQTICTNKTFSKTKTLCCQTAPSSIPFPTVGLDTRISNRRRGKCLCKQDAENICKGIL